MFEPNSDSQRRPADSTQPTEPFASSASFPRSANRQMMSTPRTGVQRPQWLTKNFKQLAVLVRDCSPSMSGRKADDASIASRELTEELASPLNRDGFQLAVVDFSSSAEVVNPVRPATELTSQVSEIRVHGGSTNFTAGLEAALHLLRTGESSEEQMLRPVVVAFTDGHHNSGPMPNDVAEQVKQLADLVTVAFGDDADEGLLKKLATSPQHFYRCRNGAELRAFFAAVGRTITGSLQQGRNATQALSQVRFGNQS